MFFTFSMLPVKEMRHSKCKTNSVKITDDKGLGYQSYRNRFGQGSFT